MIVISGDLTHYSLLIRQTTKLCINNQSKRGPPDIVRLSKHSVQVLMECVLMKPPDIARSYNTPVSPIKKQSEPYHNISIKR